MNTQELIRNAQSACRALAEYVSGQPAVRIIALGPNGGRLFDLAVPAGSGGARRAPVNGWVVTEHGAILDGTPVPLNGRRLDVLRVLIEKDVATVEDLRAAWNGYLVEESTIRWQVGELRKALKKQFGDFPGELIEATGNGYRLLLK